MVKITFRATSVDGAGYVDRAGYRTRAALQVVHTMWGTIRAVARVRATGVGSLVTLIRLDREHLVWLKIGPW